MTDIDNLMLREALAEALPQLTPLEPQAERKAALRERITAAARASKAAVRKKNDSLTIHADEGRWHVIVPGVDFKLLHQDERVKSFLLRIAPGAEVPAHEHPTDEECLVLEGEAYVGGLRLAAGAYHLARKGSRHAGNLRSVSGAVVLIHTGAESPPRMPNLAR
jgi:quercetin dioxygenase-like cupin family protein